MRGSALIRSFTALAVTFYLMLAVPAVTFAQNGNGGDNGGGNTGDPAPQFDLGTAGAAFSLLAGSFLVLKARRNRRKRE